MCECCSAKAKTIKRNILPGYNLLKGMQDCKQWPLGWYGLQKWNGPDFIWKQKVELEPKGSMKNDAIFKRWENWALESEEMEKNFTCDPQTGYELYKACLKAGYRPKRHGYRFVFWLRNHLAKKLKKELPNV